MDDHILSKKYFTPSEVAELLMVSPITVRLWSQKGELESVSTPGGHRRYLYKHIKSFANQRNLPLELDKTSGLRVLIVDDDQQFAHYLEELLEDTEGIKEIRVANDGFRAGTLIYTFEPHLVLLDLKMPHMDGFEVCDDLKKGQIGVTKSGGRIEFVKIQQERRPSLGLTDIWCFRDVDTGRSVKAIYGFDVTLEQEQKQA